MVEALGAQIHGVVLTSDFKLSDTAAAPCGTLNASDTTAPKYASH